MGVTYVRLRTRSGLTRGSISGVIARPVCRCDHTPVVSRLSKFNKRGTSVYSYEALDSRPPWVLDLLETIMKGYAYNNKTKVRYFGWALAGSVFV